MEGAVFSYPSDIFAFAVYLECSHITGRLGTIPRIKSNRSSSIINIVLVVLSSVHLLKMTSSNNVVYGQDKLL